MKRKACKRRFFDDGKRFLLFFLYFCIQYARRKLLSYKRFPLNFWQKEEQTFC